MESAGLGEGRRRSWIEGSSSTLAKELSPSYHDVGLQTLLRTAHQYVQRGRDRPWELTSLLTQLLSAHKLIPLSKFPFRVDGDPLPRRTLRSEPCKGAY